MNKTWQLFSPNYASHILKSWLKNITTTRVINACSHLMYKVTPPDYLSRTCFLGHPIPHCVAKHLNFSEGTEKYGEKRSKRGGEAILKFNPRQSFFGKFQNPIRGDLCEDCKKFDPRQSLLGKMGKERAKGRL